jgi:hypothetical protein
MGPTTNLSIELEVMAARAGLEIQADRRPAILAGYTDLRAMAERLRGMDLSAADEPANIYSFDPITRSA